MTGSQHAQRSRTPLAIAALGLGMFMCLAQAHAQVDSALKDRVGQLLDKLAVKGEQADEAEKKLVELGPRILPLLPDGDKSAEKAKRIEQIRAKLGEIQDQAAFVASKISLKRSGMRLSEAIREFQKQSGNAISDLREAEGADAPNPSIDIDFKDIPFLEALDKLGEKAEVEFTPYTSDGSIGITGTAAKKFKYKVFNGPFSVIFNQVGAVRDLQAESSTASLQFVAAWEPRVRPMLLELKAEEVKIKDDLDRDVEPMVMDESQQVVLRPDTPYAEINLQIKSPDRSAKTLKLVHVKTNVTVPAAQKLFKFPNLAKANTKIKEGDIEVLLNSTEIDEQVWRVNLTIIYPDEGPAFESYRQGLFNNRLWLQKARWIAIRT